MSKSNNSHNNIDHEKLVLEYHKLKHEKELKLLELRHQEKQDHEKLVLEYHKLRHEKELKLMELRHREKQDHEKLVLEYRKLRHRKKQDRKKLKIKFWLGLLGIISTIIGTGTVVMIRLMM
ncbi:hypothetical protein [Hazenella coriacea]|uniref:Uncharacterized protein n=1 Tax=Hazenella coriacea TaxID=1179467 RepID=A0A4R3LE75_9BACL|nr:hypothetical protein [Hazenella coriacea]TCS95746.1 hypothetical protein EDD58_102326 [Hazenella coriacea]